MKNGPVTIHTMQPSQLQCYCSINLHGPAFQCIPSLKSVTVKYGHESHGTWTREWLCWRGPAAVLNNRLVFSSERAPHINKPATVLQ
jgi:hypothetical protein